MRAAVEEFLATATPKEIEARVAKGTTYLVEPLILGAIVRADDEDEQGNWLQRVPVGAVAAAGAAKDKSGDLAASVVGMAAGSGRFVAGTASNAYGIVGGIAINAYARTHRTLAQHTTPLLVGLTEHAGIATETLTNNSSLQQIAKTFNLEKWLEVSDHVEIRLLS